MIFDAAVHTCVIVLDSGLGLGHAANAVSVMGVSLGPSINEPRNTPCSI